MRRFAVAVSGLDTPEKIHGTMGSILTLPPYYGKNLDALYDVLTDISKETVIEIDYEGMTLRALPEITLKALRVLFDAASANPCLKIERAGD